MTLLIKTFTFFFGLRRQEILIRSFEKSGTKKMCPEDKQQFYNY